MSGDAGGSILYWALGHTTPRASIDQAHDSNVWALAWHPLGHIVCSGSNDYTVRFWSRDRPGDVSKSGEKPPGAGRDGDDDEDDNYVPGLQSGTGGLPGSGGRGEEYDGPSWNIDAARNGVNADTFIPGLGGPARLAAPVEEQRAPPNSQWGNGGGGYRDNRGRGRDEHDERGGPYGYGQPRGGGRGGALGNGPRRDSERGYQRY